MRLAQRKLTPELLDEMPPSAPEAVRSRRDLRRLNRLMGHASAAAKALRSIRDVPPRLIELGAGDGTFLLSVCERLPKWHGVEIELIDRAPVVTAATLQGFKRNGFPAVVREADVFAIMEPASLDDAWLIANLFLHHFPDEALARLFRHVEPRIAGLVAFEPRRRPLSWWAARGVGLIGCNAVTRHDARVSVEAGFRGHELSRLWPFAGWKLEERRSGLFSHAWLVTREG